MTSLAELAREATTQFPDNHVEAAMFFCQQKATGLSSAFVGQSNDRLVKVGRSLASLVTLLDDDSKQLEASLQILVQECQVLSEPPTPIPRVPFGKTGLQMPIVTLGCMRFQQEWGPRITNVNMVGTDCQDNLVAILKRAIVDYGMVHIETARGYGCSELQLGTALKQLFITNQIKREDLILQTKVPPYKDPAEFRQAVETSFENLQVDYLDLFAFHGMNYEEQIEWVFGNKPETCWSVIQEYVEAGKIRHVGFSTHGSTQLICQLIETNKFAYVNLHYHYFGSYTASGGGHDGQGNLDAVKKLQEREMGIFIISPFDKGGRLYTPCQKLRSLTLPDMEPMAFMCHWIWNHHQLAHDKETLPQLHTFTLGAARPADLDQAAVAAHLHATQGELWLTKTKAVVERLEQAKIDALGKEWVETWWKGLPKSNQCKSLVEHNQIVWIYNCIKAFGLYEFGKARYHSFENNFSKWDPKLSPEQNIADNVGKNAWGFVPGLPLSPGMDYSDELANVPPENLMRVKEAHEFVYNWCRQQDKPNGGPRWKERIATIRRNFSVSSQMLRVPSFLERQFANPTSAVDNDKQETSEATGQDETIPPEWETSYDMRPWPDYPDQPSRA